MSKLEKNTDLFRVAISTGLAAGTGLGGTWTGAAAGTVISPGVGTLVGGIYGALIGGFTGAMATRHIPGLERKPLKISEVEKFCDRPPKFKLSNILEKS